MLQKHLQYNTLSCEENTGKKDEELVLKVSQQREG